MSILADYNALLKRHDAAEKFLDNPATPIEDVDRWMPEYKLICSELSKLLDEIKIYTKDEALKGFKED